MQSVQSYGTSTAPSPLHVSEDAGSVSIKRLPRHGPDVGTVGIMRRQDGSPSRAGGRASGVAVRSSSPARAARLDDRRGRSPSPLITGQRSSYIPSPDPTGRALPPSLLPGDGQPVNAAGDIMQELDEGKGHMRVSSSPSVSFGMPRKEDGPGPSSPPSPLLAPESNVELENPVMLGVSATPTDVREKTVRGEGARGSVAAAFTAGKRDLASFNDPAPTPTLLAFTSRKPPRASTPSAEPPRSASADENVVRPLSRVGSGPSVTRMRDSHAGSRDLSSRDLSVSPRLGPRNGTGFEGARARNAQTPVQPRAAESTYAESNTQGFSQHTAVSSTQLPVTQLSSRASLRKGRASPAVLSSDSSDDDDDLVPSGPRLGALMGGVIGGGARRNSGKQVQTTAPPTNTSYSPRAPEAQAQERFREQASSRNASKPVKASGAYSPRSSESRDRFREHVSARSYAEKMAMSLTSAAKSGSSGRTSSFVGRNHYTPAQMRARADLDSSSDG